MKTKLQSALLVGSMALLGFATSSANATYLVQEQFVYTGGTSLTSQTNPFSGVSWANISGAGTNTINAGSLAYAGLTGTAGEKLQIGGTSRQDGLNFNTGATNTTVADGSAIYYSAIVNLSGATNPSVAGDYFMWIGTANTTNLFRSKLHVRQGSTTSFFQLGISQGANTTAVTQWTSDLAVNTPIFVVVSYEVVTGGSNDVAKLWVNPTLGSGSPPAATLTSNDNTSADQTTFGRIGFRNPGTAIGTVQIDELKVTDSWANAAQTAAVPVTLSGFSID